MEDFSQNFDVQSSSTDESTEQAALEETALAFSIPGIEQPFSFGTIDNIQNVLEEAKGKQMTLAKLETWLEVYLLVFTRADRPTCPKKSAIKDLLKQLQFSLPLTQSQLELFLKKPKNKALTTELEPAQSIIATVKEAVSNIITEETRTILSNRFKHQEDDEDDQSPQESASEALKKEVPVRRELFFLINRCNKKRLEILEQERRLMDLRKDLQHIQELLTKTGTSEEKALLKPIDIKTSVKKPRVVNMLDKLEDFYLGELQRATSIYKRIESGLEKAEEEMKGIEKPTLKQIQDLALSLLQLWNQIDLPDTSQPRERYQEKTRRRNILEPFKKYSPRASSEWHFMFSL